MKIAVIGMGKIGLPLAVQYARKGHEVIGVDINSSTVEMINNGVEPFPEEAKLQEYLTQAVASKNLKATLSYQEAIPSADSVVVVVPLFVNDDAEPDFSAMDHATLEIGKYLKRNTLVCYETTLPIGTTRKRFTPTLERESSLTAGKDFSVVFSPERVFTGRIFEDLRKYPKIVGGITDSCTQRGIAFYEQVLDFDERQDLARPNGVWSVASAESAEFVKLAETTYRDVNIGLANQFAMYADSIGINIYEVIESANSQFFSHIHQPGISVGGHCIPVYPQFYLWNDSSASIVRTARDANKAMPAYALEQLKSKLGTLRDQTILVLGLSYRSNVKESAFSGVFDLVREIEKSGARAVVSDPLYSDSEIRQMNLVPYSGEASEIDAVILHTNHKSFSELNWSEFTKCKAIYDGRKFLSNSNVQKSLISLGNMPKGAK